MLRRFYLKWVVNNMNIYSLGGECMSKIAIIIILVMVTIYGFLYSLAGPHIAMIILALGLLIEAIILSRNPEWFDRYRRFMNPKQEKILHSKNDEFRENYKKSSLRGMYGLSVSLMLIGFLQMLLGNNYSPTLFDSRILVLSAMIVTSVFGMMIVSRIGMRRSETYEEYQAWSILAGIGWTIVFMSVLVGYMIFS